MQSLQFKHNIWVNRRLDRTQERINKLEDKTKENIQSKAQRDKKIQKIQKENKTQ